MIYIVISLILELNTKFSYPFICYLNFDRTLESMKLYLAKDILELMRMRVLIAFTFFIFIGASQAYSLTYNLSLPYSYKFSGEDYAGNKFEVDKNQGGLFNVGFTHWGFGFEIYETKLKNTSEEVKLKTNLYDVTYGATGAEEEKGWFWKYVGLGYGFGTDELTCSFCETNFYKGFAMQYILLFNIPITKSFNLKTSYHLKTSKIRHKYKSEADDYSATIINVGIGF